MRIEDLKQGMIPGEQIVKVETDDGIEYKKEDAITSSIHDRNVLISPTPEGLLAEQVQELKELSKSGHFEEFGDMLLIQRSMNFAPAILLGLLITIVCRGPFYSIIYQ